MPAVPGLSNFSVLARGGYATVYRAVQDSVAREVAVKVENRTLESDRDQRRFLREAQAAGRMSSHPHVVDLFDAGVTVDQQPYLIMELCDGSYADRMRTAPLNALETRDLGVKIADALAHAHRAGVLHRDVKPANILYSHFNSAVLADFGLAVLAEVRDPSVTLEVLTPAYAPPEMFRHSAPSPAVDVYALCATLYAVMRGKPPRWREDRNPSLITLMEMFGEPIPDLPGIPGEMCHVLRLGMANDPALRPTAEQLRDMLAGLPLHPGHPSAPISGAPVSGGGSVYGSPMPPPDNTPTVQTRKRRRLGWFFGGLGAVVLLAASGAAAWVTVGGDPDPTPTPTGVAQPSASIPSPRAVALPGCLVTLPGNGRCPDALECFGPVSVAGGVPEADPVDCATRHTWEVYAVGELPVGASERDLARVRTSAAVRRVCNEGTFRVVSLRLDGDWRLDVLPPRPADLRAGDRVYRCLAGKGPNRLEGPTLAR
jgi:tRNA A-37 threonylcarbamoyl transferase component Bud32